ncbi:MAG TPA: D-alanyl-D-alanine carboxypeptidase/D-alanyl-D-alanine-endopeptidase [Burkholderiales bacterium]|nr:D-alanyl-D-alanine carboxypeptidase/D-alanyl-D-alanine-endopeptidase [Burkholderiales bacterium]
MNVSARSLIVAALLVALPAAAQEAWPPAIQQALRAAGIPASSTAGMVQPLDGGAPLLRVNETVALNPASVMKLVTTYAGLELLGPAFRWHTTAHLGGPLREGVLEGSLILRGTGDPKLTFESFWLLLRALRDRGLREIRGDLVLDRSHFDMGAHDPSRFDAEPLRPYNVGPDALLVSFKAVSFQFVPDAERAAVLVIAQPRPVPLDVISALRISNGPCGDWREKIRADFQVAPKVRALFTGDYPASCGERTWHVALLSHPDFVGGVFRQLWPELGGSFAGAVRDGLLPAEAKLLYAHESAALAEIVRDINKFSNNVMARQLYLTLGAFGGKPPGRLEKSLATVRAWLKQKGLEMPELVIENGSGLSRVDRVSAKSLAQLLVAAFESPVMPEFAASLPLVAVDGTMRKRLKGERVAGFAHIKTGSLADVRAIGGYVLDRNGRRHAVVMMVNHANAHAAQTAMDELLRWVHER